MEEIEGNPKVKEVRYARIEATAKERGTLLAEYAGGVATVTTYGDSNRIDFAFPNKGEEIIGLNTQSRYVDIIGNGYLLYELLDFSEFNTFKGSKPKKADNSEELLHQSCYTWFHNTYPQLRGLLCYNLGNSRNKIDGARNRNKGLQAGRSDFTFYWSGRAFFIELKTPVGTTGKAQLSWAELVMKHGFEYYIVRDLETFKVLVKGIMNEEHSV